MATLIGVSPGPVAPGGYAPHPLEIFGQRNAAQDWTKSPLYNAYFRPTNTNPDGSPLGQGFGFSPGPMIGQPPPAPTPTPRPTSITPDPGRHAVDSYYARQMGPPARPGGGVGPVTQPVSPAPVAPAPTPAPAPAPVGVSGNPEVNGYFPGTPMPGQPGWFQGAQGMTYRPWQPMGDLSWDQMTDYWHNKTFTPEQLYGLATGFSGYPGRRY